MAFRSAARGSGALPEAGGDSTRMFYLARGIRVEVGGIWCGIRRTLSYTGRPICRPPGW